MSICLYWKTRQRDFSLDSHQFLLSFQSSSGGRQQQHHQHGPERRTEAITAPASSAGKSRPNTGHVDYKDVFEHMLICLPPPSCLQHQICLAAFPEGNFSAQRLNDRLLMPFQRAVRCSNDRLSASETLWRADLYNPAYYD